MLPFGKPDYSNIFHHLLVLYGPYLWVSGILPTQVEGKRLLPSTGQASALASCAGGHPKALQALEGQAAAWAWLHPIPSLPEASQGALCWITQSLNDQGSEHGRLKLPSHLSVNAIPWVNARVWEILQRFQNLEETIRVGAAGSRMSTRKTHLRKRVSAASQSTQTWRRERKETL